MTRDYASNPTPVPESTLTELFFESLDRHRDRVAFQRMPSEGVLEDITFGEAFDVVRTIAAALEESGVDRSDRVAILSENRPEWAFVDYGCLCTAIIPVPIYPTLTAGQAAYLLRDSGARMAFVSDPEQAEKVLEAAEQCPQEITVVVFDPGDLPDGVVPWEEFLERGRERADGSTEEEFRRKASSITPDDTATILYTSGTTGDPKGVVLSHNNIASNVRASSMAFEVTEADSTVSFLPLSHILQRMCDYLFMWVGCRIAYPRSIDTLTDDMKVIQPTVVVSVPRIYEKVHNRVMAATGVKKLLVRWGARVADRAADDRLAGRPVKGLLALQYRIADRLVFSKVRDAVGGRIRIFVSGGGPLAPELNRFFYSIGLTILEGYGLTETSPVTNVNTEEDFRIGTVGKPVAGTEVRIADDGEILVRGPQVMKGYYKNEEATRAVIDEEGWFATGDIGEIDDDGYLSITDRKKDIIVTAGGKNIAPQPIENRIKTHPLVEQAVVVGDRRRFPSLLVVPDFAALERWAQGKGLKWTGREELVRHPEVVAHMEHETLESMDDVARYERPKKLALLSEELTVENGFLTPSLKVKRRKVQEHFEEIIDALYEHEPADGGYDPDD
ncbi:MAG: long-chain fatty acid--CoA ligase [Gemmatimonadota bacterium]|nr:long-chain fatty acid--CoA ligase [Gemmatimonadota bacterium]